MRRRVYLCGGQAHCAAGLDLREIARRTLGLAPLPPRQALATLAGDVSVPYFTFPDARDPVARLADVAASALLEAGFVAARRRDAALLVGSSSGLLELQEAEYAHERSGGGPALALRHPYVGELAERMAARLAVGGPRFTIATACSAGANALLYAAWLIREGQVDDAVVLGAEFQNRMSLLGFHGLLLLAPERCAPFDRDRAGVVLGETAAALVLSARPPAGGGWEVLGGGTLCDTSHPTSPAPARIAQTVALALADASLSPGDITAIKAHGTGTPSNDLAEGRGLREAFGDALPPVTSLKAQFGHTLGACGVLETAVFAACLERGLVPATGGFSNIDPELGFAPLATPLRHDGGAVLLNYFGFGGNNCCLALRRAPC